MLLRLYRPADLPAVLAGAAEMGWGLLSPAERRRTAPAEIARRTGALVMQAMARPGSFTVVADDGGQVAGFALWVLQEGEVTGAPEALLFGIWVAPPYRGLGLFAALQAAGEGWCRQMGVRRMVAVIAADNAASLRATAKAGFVTEKVIRAKDLGGRMPK